MSDIEQPVPSISALAEELRQVWQRELKCMVGPDATEAAALRLRDAGGDPEKALRGEQ